MKLLSRTQQEGIIMNRVRYFSLITALVLAAGLTDAAHAQPVKYAQAGMPFLQIAVGGRSAAMAGTQQGIIGDAGAMFANPSGMAVLEGLDIQTSVTSWIADISHYGIAAAYRVGNLGTFGVNAVWMDYGTFTRTEVYEGFDPDLRNAGYESTGTFTVAEYAVGVAYARQIASAFYVGANFKYAAQNLPEMDILDLFNEGQTTVAENNINNWAFDFGTMYYPGFKDLRFGMSVRNFSNQSDYFNQRLELPLTFDFGVAMDLLSLASQAPGGSNNSLTMAVDWLHPRDYSERLHVGLEYGFMDRLFLRAGYKFNYDEESFAGGVGVKAGLGGYGLRADYAYSAFGDFFGDVHRVTLGIYARR